MKRLIMGAMLLVVSNSAAADSEISKCINLGGKPVSFGHAFRCVKPRTTLFKEVGLTLGRPPRLYDVPAVLHGYWVFSSKRMTFSQGVK